MTGKLQPEQLSGFYREVALDLGVEMAVLLHKHYKGLQVVFPTCLMDRQYIKEQIVLEYNGSNTKALAKKYGYTERWVRKMVSGNPTPASPNLKK